MKTTLFLTIWLFTFLNITAQTRAEIPIKTRPNNISLNIFGDIGGISANYERLFLIRKQFFLAGKAGFGVSYKLQFCIFRACASIQARRYLIPHHLTFNLKISRNHFFEIGLGSLPIFEENNNDYMVYAIFGIRAFRFKTFREIIRIYGSLRLYHAHKDEILFIPGGVSVGVSF